MKCLSSMLAQKKGNPEGVNRGLSVVINHLFDDGCDITWCSYNTNPSEYKHMKLPYGKDLQDPTLKLELESYLINELAPQSETLANLSSA